MKKIITKAVCLLCAGALVLGAAGCSKSADSSSAASSTAAAVYGSAEDYDYENFSYSSGLDENGYWEGVKALDYVTLPENFASLTFKRSEIEPTEEELQSEIDSLLSDHATEKQVTDRAAADGDTVNIDYVGRIDGVALDGGDSQGNGYDLTLGSGTFIDGFEDGVIGMKKDETKELNLTFPEDYSNTDLAGADVVFTVTVNHVYEETDAVLDDAFVAARNIDGVSTVAEYRQYVYDNLMSSAKSQQETELERNVLEAVTANATFKETPEEMVSRYYDRLVKNLTATASMYGIDLETFMSYSYGLAADEYEDELQKSAQSAAEQIMVMQAIAEKEGLTLTDEELQADLESSASEYGYDSVDAYQEAIGDLRGYKEYLMSEKVTKYLIENANVTETEASTEEATEETTETETETTTETATEAK